MSAYVPPIFAPNQNDVPDLTALENAAQQADSNSNNGSSSSDKEKSAVAAIIGLVGSVFSSFMNWHSQQTTNSRNEALARQQNAWNLAQWNRENTYNSPYMQMLRLKQAGINPALAWSDGMNQPASSSPEMVSSQNVAPSLGNPFSGFAQSLINERLMNSQIELNESAANKNNASAGLITMQYNIAGIRFKILQKNGESLSDQELENMRLEGEKLQSAIANINADTAIKVLEEKKVKFYVDNIQPEELRKIQAEIGLTEAQTKEVLELLPEKILLTRAQANNQNAQARLAKANAAFQEKLNESDTYVQDFIESVRIDNDAKIVSMAVDAGSDVTNYKAGITAIGYDKRGLGAQSHDDVTAYGLSHMLKYLGQMFRLSFVL